MIHQAKNPLRSGLTRKLLIGFGGVVLVLLVVTTLLAAFLTSHSRALEAVQHENYDSVRFCDGMKSALDKAQVLAQSNLQRAPNEPPALESAWSDFGMHAREQLRNTTLPGELEISRTAIDAGRAVFDKTRQLLIDPSIDDRAAFYRDDIFPQYQNCRSMLARISQMNLENLVRVNAQVRSALLAMRTTVILLLLIGVGLSAVFVLATARGMIRPLMQLTHYVRQIEDGNLDLLVETASDDEIGELGEAFNDMAAKLREFRRQDHQRLIRTQQTTQAAIDSLPDAVAVLDIHGTIEISNRTVQIHFKLDPGTSIHSIRPDWAAMFFEPVLSTQQSFVPDGYRSAIQLFDETGERFLLPRAVPMFDTQQSLIGVTLVLVEITHLRKADEFKSGLLSAVSHELKTPLTSVRMATRMLTDKRIGELNERQRALLHAAALDSERLVRTVESILSIGRVEAGRARLELADVSGHEIVRRALATVEAAAAERHISVVSEIGKGTLMVHADLNLVACAMSNLLSNAVKFSPSGSTVRIEVTESEKGIEFSVLDEGPGIAEEFRARIFEKFFRIPTPGGPGGAGLGLSIASEIIHLHDGGIRVECTPNGGSRFTVWLRPADKETSSRSRNERARQI